MMNKVKKILFLSVSTLGLVAPTFATRWHERMILNPWTAVISVPVLGSALCYDRLKRNYSEHQVTQLLSKIYENFPGGPERAALILGGVSGIWFVLTLIAVVQDKMHKKERMELTWDPNKKPVKGILKNNPSKNREKRFVKFAEDVVV